MQQVVQMMKVLNKDPKGAKQKKQDEKEVPNYAAQLDTEIISGIRNKRFKLGGHKVIRLTEEFEDLKLTDEAKKDTQNDPSQGKNLQNGVVKLSEDKGDTQKSIPQPIPDKTEFMRRGKMFVKNLEADAIKIKGK